jgi:hypothetical protein
MEEVNLYDNELHMSAEGYWVVGANGVRMRLFDGGEIYFSGAVSLEACSGNGLYLVTLADGSPAVMDAYSRVVVTDGFDIGFVTDSEIGETYIYELKAKAHPFTPPPGVLAAEARSFGASVQGVIPVPTRTTIPAPTTDSSCARTYSPPGSRIWRTGGCSASPWISATDKTEKPAGGSSPRA